LLLQGPPADIAPAPEQNMGQATNSGTAKVGQTTYLGTSLCNFAHIHHQDDPDLKERLADAQKAAASMRDFSRNVRTTASATNDVQSDCDAVGVVSSTIEPLLQSLRVFNSIADEIAKVILFISIMYVADFRA